MKPTLIFFAFASCVISAISCAHQLAPVGHYQSMPIIADGNLNEWELPLRFSNSEHTFQYSVTNDKKNIYICIVSDNQATQLRILRSGINIYFDPKGEKNKNISLEFPVKKAEENTYNSGDPITASSTKTTEDALLLQSNFYNTSGFANIENGQFSVEDKKNNIQVGIKLHNDSTLVYEAIVPINNIPGVDPYAKKSKNFSVGISVSYSPYTRNNNNNSSRPSFGMHGMRFGGGGSRRGSQRNQQEKEEAEWYQFRLAFNSRDK